MILAHIIVKDKPQALEIIQLLLKHRLLLHAAVSEKTIYNNTLEGTLACSTQTLIIGKTKGLLFSAINEILKEHFTKNMPMLYAVPIVYMNEELTTVLRKDTAKI